MNLSKKVIKKCLKIFGFRIIRDQNNKQDVVTLDTYYKYYPKESVINRYFYNFGAGSFRHQCWTNVDKKSDWYKSAQPHSGEFINYDFFSTKPLPIQPETAELCYCSHAIEHITNKEVTFLFEEVFRILKKNGIFRITCPNIDLDYRSLLNGDIDFFYFRNSPIINKNRSFDTSVEIMDIEQAFIWHIASNASIHHIDGSKSPISNKELRDIIYSNPKETALDLITSRADINKQKLYPGNHINWFNHEKIIHILKQVGFSKISREAYGQSNSPVMRDISLFDNTHPKLSLYLEAIK